MVCLETFTETHPVKWMTIRLAFFQGSVAFDCSYIGGTSILIVARSCMHVEKILMGLWYQEGQMISGNFPGVVSCSAGFSHLPDGAAGEDQPVLHQVYQVQQPQGMLN